MSISPSMPAVLPFWPALLAGIVYVMTPGPAFLAMFSSVSIQPLATGIRFAAGLLVGSSAWLVFSVVTLARAASFPAGSLDLIAIGCAVYLAYLGTRSILASAQPDAVPFFNAPLRHGLLLSFTNPKAYPVLTALFGGLVFADSGAPAGVDPRAVCVVGVLGFAAGYTLMLCFSRAPAVRAVYTRYRSAVSAVAGGVFWLFAIEVLLGTSMRSLL